jgi:adenylate cyclase
MKRPPSEPSPLIVETMSGLIQQYRGRVVDSPGDNLLAEFASVVDAVQCAVEVQQVLKVKNTELPEDRRMQFRIGINLGDVIEEGARNSTFTYKSKPVKIQQVGRELGVRYVLEGSVQKSGNRIRITAQLIDASTEQHLWAERYDRDLKDIFALQDEITMKIMTALQVKLTEGEQARLFGKGTANLQAYEKVLQGMEHIRRLNIVGNVQARELFEEAIALDPEYSMAYALLAQTHLLDVWLGLSKSPDKTIEKAVELAQKALALDDTLAFTHTLWSHIYRLKRQHKKAIAEGERAIALNPNGADAHAYFAPILFSADKPEEALAMIKKAIRLNPFPPKTEWVWSASSTFFARQD